MKNNNKLAFFVFLATVLAVVAGPCLFVASHSWHASATIEASPPPEVGAPVVPHFDTQVARGQYLFEHTGCPGCHGPQGRGGVPNQNYIRDTIPALNTLPEHLGLFGPEDVAAITDMVEHGQDPGTFQGTPPFSSGWTRFQAGWRDLVSLIQNGNPAGKKDLAGPAPPLNMPSWRAVLQPDAIRAVLVYLLSLYNWDNAPTE